MTPDEAQQSITQFFTEVGIIQQLISTRLEVMLPGRMSATQFGILSHLSRRPDGETPLQLSIAFQVPKTSMTHMLSVLQKHQFVTIAPHPDDGRSKVARATTEGQRFMHNCLMKMRCELAPVLEELSVKPFTSALPHLKTIRKHWIGSETEQQTHTSCYKTATGDCRSDLASKRNNL